MNIIGKTTVLSLALVATLLVVAVPGIDAEGATYQDIAAEDFLALAEGGIITLDADYVLTTTPTITEDLILDGQGHTIRGAINLDAQGTSEGAYTVVLKDLVMDGQGTTARAVTGQNQNDDVRPVNLTMEGVSISGYTSKGVYLTNIQSLNVTGCSFNDNATSEQTWYSGDYAFDINLCGIQNAVIVIEDTAFAGVSGGNSPIKITQRGGTDETDDISTDILTSTAATIDSVSISGCTFDITAGEGGKSPMADIVIGSSPNSDGTARTYTQAYDLTVSTGANGATVAYRNGTVDGNEDLLVFTLSADAVDALVMEGTVSEGTGVYSVTAGDFTLSNDWTVGSTINVDGNMSIDLAGNTIANGGDFDTIHVSEGSSLTVTDSVGGGIIDNTSNGRAAIVNDGTLNLNGGTVTRSAEAIGNSYYVIQNNGSMTVSAGATVSKSASSQMSSMIDNFGTLTVNGGTFDAGLDIVLKNEETGTVEIHDGSFVNSKQSAYSVQNWGTMTIHDGMFSGIVVGLTEPDSPASQITIIDGTFAAQVYAWNYAPVASPAENAPSIIIEGGEFNSGSAINTYVGGTDTSGDNRTVTLNPEVASIVVNGGSFARTPAPYLADDVLCLVDDGVYAITDDVSAAVARTGNVYWTSLYDALRSAAGAEVVLVDDVSLDAYILVNKDNVSLDLAGHTVLGDLDSELIDSYNKNFTVSDSVGGGMIINLGDGPAVDGQKVVVEGGIFSSDVSSFLAEGMACYEYVGYHIVVADTDAPALVIAGIPFASVEDALVLINIAGDFATADGDTLTLTANIPDTADVTLTIPADSGLTIDLNGYDMVLGTITVAGELNVTDTVGDGTLTTLAINVTGGSITGSGTIVAAEGTVNLISIIGSGSVSGVTLDISDVASNGGAINFETGLAGSASVYGVTILIDGADAVADRGIYVNQMPETGSIIISDVTFDFNGNDACPLSADVDGNTDLEIDGFTFIDCSRTNKVLFNAMEDVTIGSEGGIDISDITDIVLWDAASADNVFTVAGDLVVNGRMAVTFNGALLIPETETMTVNGSLEIHSDGSVEGKVYFGSNMMDSIVLTDVVPGEDAFTLSLGSVVMSGSVVSGAMVIDGNGRTVGDLDLGGSELTVSEGSTFTVGKDSEISGTTGMIVKGKMNVYGTVSAPIDNDGVVYTINNGAVTGEITGDEPQEKEDEPLSIELVPNMTWIVGETYSIPLGIHPVDAVITGIHGAEDWLTFDGHILKGAPMETGTYEITLTIGLDSNTEPVTTDFTITVVEAQVDEPDDGWDIDWRYVLIAIVLIVMIVILVARFL